jgi:hypothetical protein
MTDVDLGILAIDLGILDVDLVLMYMEMVQTKANLGVFYAGFGRFLREFKCLERGYCILGVFTKYKC